MALDLTDCQFTGPALPEPFVRFELEKELTKLKLLAKTTGEEGKQLKTDWETYEPLWREQVGDAWRDGGKEPFTWPVLAGDDDRWEVRAAIDAVVADAYGLSRDQYEHVLSTFSHKSYPKTPELCLAKFDELMKLGLDAFTRKHDPYHDIPLNENLPQPVIDLPIPAEAERERTDKDRQLGLFTAAEEETPYRESNAPKPKRSYRKRR